MDSVIENISIVAGKEMRLIQNGYISISGNRIEDYGERKPGRPNENQERIDGRHMIVMPGLLDCHTHIGDSVAKDVGVDMTVDDLMKPPNGLKHKILESTPSSDLIAAMRDTMQEMIRYGTMVFADFREGGREGVEYLRTAAQGLHVRPVILGRFAKPKFSEAELKSNTKKLSPTDIDEARRTLTIADGFSASSVNDLTDPAFEQLRELTQEMQKMRAIHVSETTSSVEVSMNRTGRSEESRVVKHFSPNFIVHMTNPTTNEDIDLLARNNVPVVCCPRANCRLADGYPPIMNLYRRGIKIALGTDNMIVNPPDIFEEMEFLSKSLRGIERNAAILPPVEILKMGTINGAQALGLQNDLGSIEKGKLANLIFIDPNTPRLRPIRDPISTIVHRVRSSDLKAVMVEGQIVSGSLSE